VSHPAGCDDRTDDLVGRFTKRTGISDHDGPGCGANCRAVRHNAIHAGISDGSPKLKGRPPLTGLQAPEPEGFAPLAPKLTTKLAFRDKAGRDHMTKFDGFEDQFDRMEGVLRSLTAGAVEHR
jgi:hypothetical protein